MQDIYRAIHRDPAFTWLEVRRRRFSWILTAVVLIAYFAFILTVAFAPQWLAVPIYAGSSITWGIPAGLSIIVLSFLLTGVYVHRSNSEFDLLMRQILTAARGKAKDVGG